MAEGEVKIIKNENSITENYLSGKKFIAIPKKEGLQKMVDLSKLLELVEII